MQRLAVPALLPLIAAAALSACAGLGAPPESGLTPLSMQRMARMTMPVYDPRPSRPDPGKSWMDPSAKKGKSALLYVSDWSTNDVYVYHYPSGKPAGTLTGFSAPYGQCVDKKGDVFITNYDGWYTDEYANGGTTPIKTFTTGGYEIGCSVDAQGDVAITDNVRLSGFGDVYVWTHGSGSPAVYSDSDCDYLWAAGYDDKGNLIGEGENGGNHICAVLAGAQTMTTLSFNQFINFPGGTMWDGKHIALTDLEANGIYVTGIWPATLSGSALSAQTETLLTDDCNGDYSEVIVPFIVGKKNTPVNHAEGKTVIGGNLQCASGSYGKVNFWAYPYGGNPRTTIAGPTEPYGQSVSFGK